MTNTDKQQISEEQDVLDKLRAIQAAFVERSSFMQAYMETLEKRIDTLEARFENQDNGLVE